MKKYIVITVDTNDGDYVTEKYEIVDENMVVTLKNILDKLPRQKLSQGGYSKHIRYETIDIGDTGLEYIEEGILTEEEVGILENHLPYREYGIHTIISVDVITVVNEISLI